MIAPARATDGGMGLLGRCLPGLAILSVIAPPLAVRAAFDGLLRQDASALAVVGGVVASVVVLGLVVSPLVLRRQLRRPVRSPARLRISLAAIGVLLHAVCIALATYLGAANDTLVELSAGGVPAWVGPLATPYAVGGLLALGGSVSCWPLLPERVRKGLLLVVDAILLALLVFAVIVLPARPPQSAPDDLTLPVVRHTITTFFVLRLLWRLLPLTLDAIERSGFRSLVASRHLRAEKSGFLAAISVLSVLAVTLSSCALTTTLSVMGGFRQDLKRKILGNNAHIVLDRDYATIEGWDPLISAIEGTDGVVGVAPFASGEVMISSATNLGTAVLRGIDPKRVGSVNDLPRNLRSGQLGYLEQPEQLLQLPADLGGPLLPMMPSGLGADGGVPGETSQSPEARKSAELTQRIAALEAFLKESEQGLAGAPAKAEVNEADVLPGIIIGQELARSLRVYLGDEVNVVAPLGALGPSGPMPKSRPFRVAGVFYSGMYEYDMKFTYVSLETGQRFLGIGQAISGIEVKVHNVDDAPRVADSLREHFKQQDLQVKDWQQLNSRLFGALALEKLAMFIALGVSIVVASFCIAGTLTLMVQEKGREVAILKAMGTADRAIVGVFVIEGGLIGVLGSTLGLFLGYMMCFAAEHFGIRMNPEVYYIDRLPVHIDATEFALTGLASVAVCLLITVYPALLASRLRPVEALRYE